MNTVAKRVTMMTAALMLAWSVSAQALTVHGRAVVPRVHVGIGNPYSVDPLLAGPDVPFGVLPLEEHRPMTETGRLAPEPTHTLHEVVKKRAQGGASTPAPAPSAQRLIAPPR